MTTKINSILEKVRSIDDLIIDDLRKRIISLENQLQQNNAQSTTLNNQDNSSVEEFSNSNYMDFFSNFNINNIKKKINFNMSKQLKTFLLFLSIIVLSILIIHSFRKPIMIEGLNKKFYVFPEELNNIQKLLKR